MAARKRGGSGVSVRGRRRAYKPAEERRAEIVEATLAILAEEGLHAWTTAAVAERVRVSEATIFRHFDSKEEILATAGRHLARALRERVEAYEGAGGPWERAEGLVFDLLRFMEETGGAPLTILTGQAVRMSPTIRQDVMATRAAVHGRLTALFAEALAKSPRAARVEPATVADLAIAIGQSTGLRWLMEGRRRPLRATASAMFAALQSCVGAPSPAPPGREA